MGSFLTGDLMQFQTNKDSKIQTIMKVNFINIVNKFLTRSGFFPTIYMFHFFSKTLKINILKNDKI